MPASPVVSVIMNCRNSAEFLREAIDSVYAQTFQDWEIIFWDNCSTDQSPQIAQSYIGKPASSANGVNPVVGPAATSAAAPAATPRTPEAPVTPPASPPANPATSGLAYERMRYFRAETPTLLGEARNLAIAKSTAPFIAFLDCDDLWLPEKLEKQVQLFNNPKVGLVCTDTISFSENRDLSHMFKLAAPHRGMAFAQLLTAGWISMSSAMIRRQALNELDCWFDPVFNVAEEADLFYRIAYSWELDYVNAPLTRWRVHESNTTFKKYHQFADETRLILRKHLNLYPGYAEKYPQLVALLTRRSAFQKGVALWRDGYAKAARKELSPWVTGSAKFMVFWLATWLPGKSFDKLARIYQVLPKFLRR